MTSTPIKTQAQLDLALKKGKTEFEFVTKGEFEIKFSSSWIKVSVSASLKWDVLIKAWGSSRVEAWESSSVEAWESSSVVARESSSVVAWGSSSVEARESSSVVARESSSVEAWGSSSVVAWESSSVVARESSSVEAWGSSRVVARGSSRVVAWGFVSLSLWGKASAKLSVKCHAFLHSRKVKVVGGKRTEAYVETPSDWCAYYGAEVKGGIAILYKAVNDDYSSDRDPTFKYIPGTTPEAEEIDNEECSKGLHFCAHPAMSRTFHLRAKRFVACPVKVSEIIIHPEGDYPHKCKAKRVYKPCWEVDEDGNRIEPAKKT